MYAVIGHGPARRMLEAHLPQVVSILGPQSVGKRTLAIYLAQFHGFAPVDSMEFQQTFTAEKARQLREFSLTAPFGEKKLALVHLDKAPEAALNDMLKLLEEPPSYMYFILISSKPTLPTVTSRSQPFYLAPLLEEELCSVLTRFNGMSVGAASKVAFLGQVNRAKEAYENVNAKATALAVLKAVEAKDVVLFKRSFKAVDDSAARMIEEALLEASEGDWRLFSASDLPVLGRRPEVARKLLEALSRTGSARRSLSARVVLEPLVRRN